MELVIISIIGIVFGVLACFALTQRQSQGVKWILIGAVICILFSWSTMTFAGYIVVLLTEEALSVVPFWLFGVPIVFIIGVIAMSIGWYKLYQEKKQDLNVIS